VISDKERQALIDKIEQSPTYKMAELDTDFLQNEELRGVRMELEYRKPEIVFKKLNINSTVIVFGGTRVIEKEDAEQQLHEAEQALKEDPQDTEKLRAVEIAQGKLSKSHYYAEAREFGRMVTSSCQADGECDFVITTGGGPGVMEAANRGAFDAGGPSIGLNITLPHEQEPNPYITPELCFLFHYFAIRKMHFLVRAKALVVFPGGFGTLDELFETLTLRQTNRMQEIPVILYGSEYWKQVINFPFLSDQGVISDKDLDLISFADSPEQAWEIISNFQVSTASDY
jgi:uncharacterized protein (TIGR00730 family)